MAKNCFSKVLLLSIYLTFHINVIQQCSASTSLLFPSGKYDTDVITTNISNKSPISVNLRQGFKFLNKVYHTAYLYSDGYLSFSSVTSTSANATCGTASSSPMIMIFHSEEQHQRVGTISYYQASQTHHLQSYTLTFFSSLSLHTDRNLKSIFAVTWRYTVNVAGVHYSNLYQLVLANDDIGSYVVFYYNQAKPSGNLTAAGVDGGNGNQTSRYFLPGSCSFNGNIQTRVVSESNVNKPGIWAFQVDREIVKGLTCSNFQTQKAISQTQFIYPITGNAPLIISGLCINLKANITCEFKDGGHGSIYTIAKVTKTEFTCPVPYLHKMGQIEFVVRESASSSTINELHKGFIYTQPEYKEGKQPLVYINKTESSVLLTANWNSYQFHVKDTSLSTLSIVVIEFDGKRWKEIRSLAYGISNNGVFISYLAKSSLQYLFNETFPIAMRTFALKASIYVYTYGGYIEKLLISQITLGMDILFTQIKNASAFDSACHNWYEDEHNLRKYNDIIPCPSTVSQAENDWRFLLDKSGLQRIHVNKNISCIYLQKLPSDSEASSQCSYDKNRSLLPGSGDTTEFQSYSSTSKKNYYDHYSHDVLPYLICCKWGSNGTRYYQSKRFLKLTSRYTFPKFARAVGQGHMTTFNGLHYTFLASGEYEMITNGGKSRYNYKHAFKMHIGIGELQFGSVRMLGFTVAAMQQTIKADTNTVQVYFSSLRNRLNVLVNNESLPTDSRNDELNFNFEGVHISFKSNLEVVIAFSTGFAFNITGIPNCKAIAVIASVDQKWNGKIRGLWGTSDNDMANELVLPDGSKFSKIISLSYRDAETFAMTWKVQNKSSIIANFDDFNFIHGTGSRASWYSSFANPPENFGNPELCEDDDDCKFDFNVTSNNAYALATKSINLAFHRISQQAEMSATNESGSSETDTGLSSSSTTAMDSITGDEFDFNTAIVLVIGIAIGGGIVTVFIVSDAVKHYITRRRTIKRNIAEVNFNMPDPLVQLQF